MLPAGGRIAVIGAGPSGLAAAKHALQAGFELVVFEASDAIGGQWHTSAAHSGVWPGMHTNTSRAMTAFSDFRAPDDQPLHPAAEQINAYLGGYADRFAVRAHIRLNTPVVRVTRDRDRWLVNSEPFDAVVVASGRFRKPTVAPGLERFNGEMLHAFDYPGAGPFQDRRTLVYGNGISGVEIASDLAPVAPVISAFRKPRYVIQKVVNGVSSDWQWYTYFGALQRRALPRDEFARRLRDRVLRVAGNPRDFGAPEPDPDILSAGLALCQDYLTQVAAGDIQCRPAIAAIDGRSVTFADGTIETIDAIISATGYELDIPYLPQDVWRLLGPDLRLHLRTLHPELPGLGFIGQFLAQGPYFPLLELQARWIIATWAGDLPSPDDALMRRSIADPPPPLDPHNVLATALAEQLGVAPDLQARPEMAEALLFGPMLPPRYRLDGPGAMPEAATHFTDQLARSPRAPVDEEDIAALADLGVGSAATWIATSRAR